VKKKSSRFIAAKVNINENIFSADKEELIESIPGSIKSGNKLEKNSWTWEFTDVVPVSEGDQKYVYGHLVKSRYETVNVVDGDKTVNYEIPKPVANMGRFLYQAKNEILIFEESPLNRQEFIEAFGDLIHNNNISVGEVKITFIPIKSKVIKEIKSIEVLTKIEFDIIPPNMIQKKTFKGLNDIINDENATRMKTTFENENGLNKEGEFIEEGIEMVSNAYGEVKAYGHNLEPRSNRKGNKKVKKRFLSRDSIHLREINVDNKEVLLSKLKRFAIDMRNVLL